MCDLADLKKRAVQYYINNPYSDYTINFIEYWRGDTVFSRHHVAGRFIVEFSEGFITRTFSCYISGCNDDTCDRIIDDIRKALKQGMKKHWMKKWQNKGLTRIKDEK